MDDAEIADRLLSYLARKFDRANLRYADGPGRITGGRDAAIFGFALADPPGTLSGPLILRLNRPVISAERVTLEAVVHNWLASQNYPIPAVRVAETDPAPLGGRFTIMTRLAGRALADEVGNVGGGGSLLSQARGLLRVPAILRDITDTWVDVQLRLHALDPSPLLTAVAAAGLDPALVTFDGQFAKIVAVAKQSAANQLEPGIDWLRAHRPAPSLRQSICHGDFHPLNIMADAGQVTGVIDWTNIVIAPAEMDVGSAIANIATAPFDIPTLLRPVFGMVMARILRRYRHAYAARRPLDDALVNYFQVFRCMTQLTWVAAVRAAATGSAGTFDSDAGANALVKRIRALAGVTVAVAGR
jgi:aminoglycoside phosphotransferase (APT) family kinase protein